MQELQFLMEKQDEDKYSVAYAFPKHEYRVPERDKTVEWIAESFMRYLSKIEEKRTL